MKITLGTRSSKPVLPLPQEYISMIEGSDLNNRNQPIVLFTNHAKEQAERLFKHGQNDASKNEEMGRMMQVRMKRWAELLDLYTLIRETLFMFVQMPLYLTTLEVKVQLL